MSHVERASFIPWLNLGFQTSSGVEIMANDQPSLNFTAYEGICAGDRFAPDCVARHSFFGV